MSKRYTGLALNGKLQGEILSSDYRTSKFFYQIPELVDATHSRAIDGPTIEPILYVYREYVYKGGLYGCWITDGTSEFEFQQVYNEQIELIRNLWIKNKQRGLSGT